MWKLWLVLCGVVTSAIAQTDASSITYTATRSVTTLPDQIRFDVVVTTSQDATLDQVLAILRPIGIVAGQLVQVYDQTSDQTPLKNPRRWSFAFTVPMTKTKPAVAALSALPRDTVSFQASGASGATQMDDFSRCSYTDLLAEARAQALAMAALAEGTVGQILALSDGGEGEGDDRRSVAIAGIFPYQRIGDFADFLLPIARVPYPQIFAPTQSTTCTLSVKFQLLRYR